MAVVVALSAGSIGFMLVFLRALLRDARPRQPFYALLLQVPRPNESDRRGAARAGRA